MQKYIVISGDLVASTSLTTAERERLEQQLEDLFNTLKSKYNTYSRRVKGDYLECVVPEPQLALTIALLIKTCVTSFDVERKTIDERVKAFQTYGIRLALGYGTLERYDSKKGIIDGEAIYKSGRAISKETTHNKDRIVIKKTFFFDSENEQLNNTAETIFALIDHILGNNTNKQNKVLHLKLLGLSEKEISKKLGVSQPSVNQHSTASGWNAIDKTVHFFPSLFN